MKITLESYRYGDDVGILFRGDADDEGQRSFAGTAENLDAAFADAKEMLQIQIDHWQGLKQNDQST